MWILWKTLYDGLLAKKGPLWYNFDIEVKNYA
jgi:hypothetical protein